MKRIISIVLYVVGLLALVGGVGYVYLQHALERSETDEAQISAFFAGAAQRPDYARQAEPCRQRYPGRRAFFGALHIHTAASFDATAFGVINNADDAYAFARGRAVEYRLNSDPDNARVPQLTISRPLDFAAVTDHAGRLGERRICEDVTMAGYSSLLCRVYRGDLRLPLSEDMQPLIRLASQAVFGTDRSARICGEDGAQCRELARSIWEDNRRAAERWQDASPDCAFTTFPAYEYTLAEAGSNLHRNVIFANATVPPAVPSAKEQRTPAGLWRWLREKCKDIEGECDVMAIPHNSNWSSGRMWFPYSLREQLDDKQRREIARLRQQMEPLAEIMQVKGDSECRNGLGSVYGGADEFCDFEKLRPPAVSVQDCGNNVGSGNMLLSGCLSRFSYVRYALSTGLAEQQAYGINPFKFGIVAATDNHNATASADSESQFMGSIGRDRDAQSRLRGALEVPGGIAKGNPSRYNPGGLAGVWAQENSRPAIFAAMRRRETFGTSGPHIEPRFFAGWDIDPALCDSPDMIAEAYASAVPMGSELPQQAGPAPAFLASAVRAPVGHALQRIQVIKGWVDDAGRTWQKVYDVAGAPDNSAGVNPDTCATFGQGYNQLCGVWRDPDFDPQRSAVYYARVLENPSCRWSTYQCNQLPAGRQPVTCSDPDLPRTIQERAWTSPIWYSANQATGALSVGH